MERFLKSKLKNGKFANLSPENSGRMSAVRSQRNRTTELALRMTLVRAGITGWVLHEKMLGRPDFYFPTKKLAIFVDGCFWHGCRKCGHIPNQNKQYWSAKLLRNRMRDKETNKFLRAEGIFVIRFWEHELKKSNVCLQRLRALIRNLN
jgi:DNA mismatch endonuclease, patch repair protein